MTTLKSQNEKLLIPDGNDDNGITDDRQTPPPTTTTPLSKEQHRASIIALCCCCLAHSWLIINVFPYSGFMALDLLPSTTVTKENVGSYAGLISSFFMAGRTISAYSWGKIADIYGRKFTIQLSLSLTCIFSLLFGLSSTFTLALLWRFMIGLVNGIFATSRTIVSEIAYGNQRLETLGMGLIMGMWGWGYLIGPAISGALAEPIQQYPNSNIFLLFESILIKSPFLLPNLLSIIICLFSMMMVHIYIPETLPKEHCSNPKYIVNDFIRWLLVRNNNNTTSNNNSVIKKSLHQEETKKEESKECDDTDTNTNESMMLLDKTYGSTMTTTSSTIDSTSSSNSSTTQQQGQQVVKEQQQQQQQPSTSTPLLSSPPTTNNTSTSSTNTNSNEATIVSLWSSKITRNHLIVFWFYAALAVAIDEAFPLYCLSEDAGLGITELTIGKILSGSGLLYVLFQYVIYSKVTKYFGLYKSIIIGCLLSCPLVILIPLISSLFFKKNDDNNNNNNNETITYICLSIVLAIIRIFVTVVYATIATATNRTVLSEHRGTMNGLSNLGASIAQAIGPIFAGCLIAFCISNNNNNIFPTPAIGIIVMWSIIGCLGLGIVGMAIILLFLPSKKLANKQQ